MPIPAVPEVKPSDFWRILVLILVLKYRDPLHILIEYIANVSAVDITSLSVWFF
jgi:hypothetical protein